MAEHTQLKKIEDFLGKDYLKKLKVFHPVTLFPPNFAALKEYRCPLCGLKLKFTKNNKIAICKGSKHKKNFVIQSKRLIEILYK